MSHKNEIEYVRDGKTIRSSDAKDVQTFTSISKAKAWSREWQKKNGGLGVNKLRLA